MTNVDIAEQKSYKFHSDQSDQDHFCYRLAILFVITYAAWRPGYRLSYDVSDQTKLHGHVKKFLRQYSP